jgi:drug/metabolite transporter (DMT)-like permease
VASSTLGGGAVAVTRFVIGHTDAVTLACFRFGIGLLILLPLAFARGSRWLRGADIARGAAVGLLFFGGFPVLFNSALRFTTSSRGALALSTTPLLTMAVGAILGSENPTARKMTGVLVAMTGVSCAMLVGIHNAPVGAWRGDLLMVAAALCMAIYNVLARPLIGRSGAIPFSLVAMGSGVSCLLAITLWRNGFAATANFGMPQWAAVAYLGIGGGAMGFYLWTYALARASSTKVAMAVTVNPIAASLVAALLLGEPITWHLMAGLAMVFTGLYIATRPDKPAPVVVAPSEA